MASYLTPTEVSAELRIGRRAALELTKRLGARVSARRWVVARSRLEQFLGVEEPRGKPEELP